MDETEGKAQDTSHEGDSSGGAGGSTSTETFTKAQVEQMTRKAANDALAKVGRDAKSFEAREKAIKDAEAKVNEWQRQQEEAEVEKYRDDPDGLKSLRSKQEIKKAHEALKKERDDFEAQKSSYAEKLTRAEETELELTVWKAAQAKGIDANTLKEKCVKFNLKTEDQISDMAETLASSNSKTDELHVDSGKGRGGSQDYSAVRFDSGAPSAQEMISKGLNKK